MVREPRAGDAREIKGWDDVKPTIVNIAECYKVVK